MAAQFLEDLYPTPEAVIATMLDGIKLSEVAEVLDLGAGRGDIAEYILEEQRAGRYYHYQSANIDCVEINPDLQAMLRGKGLKVVHDDIRTFTTHKQYDLIVANFPFSIGAECLKVALILLERNGGHLRCLVNAETIKKPFSNLREMVKRRLEELGAEIEYLPGEFVAGERRTKVEAALIKLHVERPEAPSILLDSLTKAEAAEVEEGAHAAALVENDYTAAMVARFNLECRLGIRLIDEWYALKPHVLDRIKREGEEHDYSKPLIKLEVEHGGTSKRSNVNKYLEGVRRKYWALLLDDPRFNGLYTSNILNELKSKLNELKDFDFTLFNIQTLIEEMRGKIVEGIEASILALFDKFTRKFTYNESIQNGNVWFYNGWKSNKAHKVNRRIILPMNGLCAWSSRKSFDYRIHEELRDMVKVFSYLDKERANVRLLVGNACERAERTGNFRGVDFGYFEVSFFSSTAHIKFKDERLLAKFNIFAAQRKKWLPPTYGKKAYEAMDAEEREVVDNFQGREAYEEVVKESAFYIVEPETLLSLAGEEAAAPVVDESRQLAPASAPALQVQPEEAANEEGEEGARPHVIEAEPDPVAPQLRPAPEPAAQPQPTAEHAAAPAQEEEPEQEDAGEAKNGQRFLFRIAA